MDGLRPGKVRHGVFVLSFFSLLLFAFPGKAIVGETREGLDQRYGKGKAFPNGKLYRTPDYHLTAYFAGGKSVMEVFGSGHNTDGKRLPLSEATIQALLDENGQGYGWNQAQHPTSPGFLWQRKDGKIFARYLPDQAVFLFMAQDIQQRAVPSPH